MKFYKKPRQIKAISFDLDDTLYNNAPVIAQAEIWFADMLADRYRLPDYCRAVPFWKAFKEDLMRREPPLVHDVTMLRAHALAAAFDFLKVPLKGGTAEGLALTREFVKKRSQVTVPEESLKLLACLRQHVPVIALSNGNIELKIAGLEGKFDLDLRPSLKPGWRSKPCADLYLRAAELMGIEVYELLHVGDEPLTDVQGALNAGAQCAWLKGGIAGLSPSNFKAKTLPELELEALTELYALRPWFTGGAKRPGAESAKLQQCVCRLQD